MSVTLKSRLDARDRPDDVPMMHQDWRNLLFLHWKCDSQEIQKTLPPGLFVDSFQGYGYLTISPFFMENVSMAGIPSLPGLSRFIEVNVRTYVYDKHGIPGIWFYSLDINNLIAAKAARNSFALPYFYANLNGSRTSQQIAIDGTRMENPKIDMRFIYQPSDQIPGHLPYFAQPETLDFFLIERYALFSFTANQLSLGRVHHKPYPLYLGKATEWNHNFSITETLKISPSPPDLIHYSTGVDVDIFKLKRV